MSNPRTLLQPVQRLPFSKKTKKWRKENVDYADGYSFYNNEKIRKSLKNKIINLNLYNGILDYEDLNRVINPYMQDASFITKKIPHHPIMVSKINLLVGEEMKRVFEPKIIVTNQDAITEKQEEKKRFIEERIREMLESRLSEEEMEEELVKFERYMTYEWKDLRERMVNQLYNHYSKEKDFKSIFNDCFKDALIMGEEIVQVEIVNGEPTLTKLNPLKVHTVRSGNSDKIEDSHLIVIEDHWSPSKIIDYFHEDLKDKEIDTIMEFNTKTTRATGEYSDDYNHTLLRDALDASGEPFLDGLLDVAEINGHHFSSDLTDENGNIRVFRVYWRSLKKMKKVTYFDENGDEDYKLRTEEYIENKALGETSKTIWVNEWWTGTKIGKDIYINMKPNDIQYNKAGMPSYGHPGIVGQIYSTNQGKSIALVDRMKNYNYLYDVMWDRLNKAISTNYGKLLELDIAKVPEGWEIEKWLHFAVVNKIAVVNSFKEGNKGASTGKLAGGMNTMGGRAIDMETGSYIQSHIQLLEFIKEELGEIAGVTRQREGQITNRETVGGVERSVNQSANITEYWFNMHERFKIRVIEVFIEAAKIALRDSNKKVQYILDDMTIQVLNIDGELMSEADYGIVVANTSKLVEIEQTIHQLMQAYIQNNGKFSTVIDILMSDSIADKRRKIEYIEMKEAEAEQQARQEEMESRQQEVEARMESEQADRDLKDKMNERDNLTKQYGDELRYLQGIDNDGDGIIDPTYNDKLKLEQDKLKTDTLIRLKELENDMKKHTDIMKREDKKISVARNKNKQI